MRGVLAILACGFAVAGCASGSDALKSATPTTTLQFESEPAGAEVKTSTGQTCKTPCAMAVPAADLMATYTLKGFKPATVPVKLVPPTDTRSVQDAEGATTPALPTFTPSPVMAELEKAGPPPRQAPRRPARPATTSSDAAPPPPSTAQRQPAPQSAPPPSSGGTAWPPAPSPPSQVR
jgi:hypothetical protein